MIARFRTLLICALLSAGCSRSSDQSANTDSRGSSGDRLSSGPPATSVDSAAQAASSPCPRTGRWALCSVEKRLEESGFVVRRVSGEPPRRAGFSVTPTIYTLGRSRLEVFIYPSESALAADVASIDTVSSAPRGAPKQWETAPTFVRSGNLAAVFLTDSETQAERLTLALTAGAPQR